ncbi:DUF1311 domain-containing protein [Massilia atriviolacea]|nr:lysozyme inhibitor LprI family protein [Massilia atriviolacea]
MKYLLLSIALFAGAAARAEPPMSESMIRAVATKMGTTPAEVRRRIGADRCERVVDEMIGCSTVYLRANEIRMEEQLARAQQRLPDAKEREKLDRAQQAWIAFRDASCAYQERAHAGRTAYPLMETACQSLMTEERTRTLRGYADCRSQGC